MRAVSPYQSKGEAVHTITKTPVKAPELEQLELPMNTFNNKAPFIGKVKSIELITGPKSTGDTYNIVIETQGKIPFWEGQSYGVIPPVRDGCRPDLSIGTGYHASMPRIDWRSQAQH